MKILNNEKRTLLILFTVAIAVRLTFIFFGGFKLVITDSKSYIYQANRILSGDPISSFPNGYPLIISFLILVFGDEYFILALIVLNLFAHLATALILYQLSKLLVTKLLRNYTEFNEEKINIISYFPVLIFTFYPSQVYYSGMILTEAISTFLVTIIVYNFVRRAYFSAGIIAGLLTAVRSSFALVIPVIILLALFKKNSPSKSLLAGFSISYLSIILLSLIGITAFPTNQNYNFLIAISGTSSNIVHDTSNFTFYERAYPFLTYIKFAVNNFWEFSYQRIVALYELWGPYPFEINTIIFKFIIGFRFILFLSFLFIIVRSIKQKLLDFDSLFGRFMISCAVFVANITIIHTIYFSSFRFIVPIEPILFIILTITAVFIKYNVLEFKSRKSKSNAHHS